jgi:hypothetical protein
LEALKQAAAPHLHCQECGCDFPQRHAADRRQFCSRACYYASLRGKPPACVPQPTLREYCREMGRRGAARMRELVRDDVFAACYATGAVPVPRDEGTGRILIPSSLRLHAGLVPGREVTWTGMQRAALVSAAAPGRVPVTALRAVGELLRRTAL